LGVAGCGLERAEQDAGCRRASADARLPSAGGEARLREEVMPGETSGEVMLALLRQEAKKRSKEASGDVSPPSSDCAEQHRRTQCWQRSRQVAMPASRGSDSKSITARHSDKAPGQNPDLQVNTTAPLPAKRNWPLRRRDWPPKVTGFSLAFS